MTHTHLIKEDVVAFLQNQIEEHKASRPLLQLIRDTIKNETYPKVTKQVRVGNVLTPDEIDEAKRLWQEDPDTCAQSMNETFPELPATLEGWIVYTQWACGEYGASPFFG